MEQPSQLDLYRFYHENKVPRLQARLRTPDTSKRCKRCTQLTLSSLLKRENDEPHCSLDALERQADLGCDFCQFIIGCLKRARPKVTETGKGGISVYDHEQEYIGWGRSNKSQYAFAKELDKLSPVWLRLDINLMFYRISSWEVNRSEKPSIVDVYDTFLIKLGDLPSVVLNMAVSQEDSLPFPKIRLGRYPVDPDLGSPFNLSIAKGWLDKCSSNHTQCRTARSPCLPTRVLDVEITEGLHICRLVETRREEGEYLAFSHCWGGKIRQRLTKETRPRFLRSIQIDTLPANFRDAIHVTRQLGMRYLWIDALCIIQDSPDDWVIESGRMGSIYQNAALTIFAMVSEGSEEGFLHKANQLQPTPTTLTVLSTADNQISALLTGRDVEEENFSKLNHSSALSRRGWCFQEMKLSRRSLVFGARQIYWQCREVQDCLEGVYPPIGTAMMTPDMGRQLGSQMIQAMKKEYYNMVTEYNTRSLTFSSDKLPAFSGLAQKYHHVFGGEYLAGLWSTDLHHGLLWILSVVSPSSSLVKKPYRAPSWSWALTGALSDIRIHFHASETGLIEFQTSDVRPLSTHNRYGEIDPGSGSNRPSLTLQGSAMPFLRRNCTTDPGHPSSTPHGYVRFDVPEELGYSNLHPPEIQIVIINKTFMLNKGPRTAPEQERTQQQDQELKDPNAKLQCSYIALAVDRKNLSIAGVITSAENMICGLVLRESGNAFERVGFWQVYTSNDWDDWSRKEWQKRTLKLI